jgi:hypothetical protein
MPVATYDLVLGPDSPAGNQGLPVYMPLARYDHSLIGLDSLVGNYGLPLYGVPEYMSVVRFYHSLIGPDSPVGNQGLPIYLSICLRQGMIIGS